MSHRFTARACASVLAVALGTYASCAAAALPLAPKFAPENYTEDVANLQKAVDAFHGLEKTAQSNDPVAITRYVQTGLTMSNISCDMWLVSLGRTDRDTSFFKDVLNIVGNLILGISGINGANPSALARGNLFLGAGNAAVDAYRNEFLMGVISDIEMKIKSGRKLAEQALLDDMPKDVEIAKRRLLEYHDTCTPTAIKELLKTSLQQVAYVRPDTTLANPVNDARASLLASQLSSLVYGGAAGANLTADDIYRLWVVKIGAPTDTSSTTVAGYKAAADVKQLVSAFDAKDSNGQLTSLLKQIGELRNYVKRLQDERDKETQARQDEQIQKAQADLDKATTARAANEQATAAAQAAANNTAAAAAADAAASPDAAKKADAAHTLSILQQHPGLLSGLELNAGVPKLLSKPGEHALHMQAAATDLAAKQAALQASIAKEDQARRTLAALLAKRTVTRVDSGPASITPILVPVSRP